MTLILIFSGIASSLMFFLFFVLPAIDQVRIAKQPESESRQAAQTTARNQAA